MTKKLSALSRAGKQLKRKEINIYKLTPNLLLELGKLAAMPDEKIKLDDKDAPEIKNWEKLEVGKFYRPIKKQVSIRLDADVLEWFKRRTGQYQTLINQACRCYIREHCR